MRALLFLLAGSAAHAVPVDFVKDIQPILKTRCLGCHGAEVQMGGLRLDRKSALMRVVKPGASSQSPLIHRVMGVKGLALMPPSGPRLTTAEIGKLRAWIDQGVTWPMAKAGAPDAKPADGFVLAKLDPKANLRRRVIDDLTYLTCTIWARITGA